MPTAETTTSPGTSTGYQEAMEWRIQASVGENWVDTTRWIADDKATGERLEWLRSTAAPGVKYRRLCRHLALTITAEG